MPRDDDFDGQSATDGHRADVQINVLIIGHDAAHGCTHDVAPCAVHQRCVHTADRSAYLRPIRTQRISEIPRKEWRTAHREWLGPRRRPVPRICAAGRLDAICTVEVQHRSRLRQRAGEKRVWTNRSHIGMKRESRQFRRFLKRRLFDSSEMQCTAHVGGNEPGHFFECVLFDRCKASRGTEIDRRHASTVCKRI